MAIFQMVPVERLIEPLNPQRTETLLEKIDELRESIRTNGLQQPIGVLALPDNQYRVIWGHRRSIAVTQLQWEYVPAMVYAEGEANEDQLMGAENYHRNNTSDAEEALYYQRILPNFPDGTIGIARELNVPQRRVETLLGILQGTPEVWAALQKRQISIAQAAEINRFQSQGYRLHALERAVVEGTNSVMLSKWRRELKRMDMDRPDAQVDVSWDQKIQPIVSEIMDVCQIGNHDTELSKSRFYRICNDHYNILIEGLETLGQRRIIEEAGYLPDYKRLIRKAEQELSNGGQPIQSGDTEGSTGGIS